MRRAGDDLEARLGPKLIQGRAIEIEHERILLAHDEQGRRGDAPERRTGEIDATATRHDRIDVTTIRGGEQGGGRPGARAEVADREVVHVGNRLDGAGRAIETPRQERDVEAKLGRACVDELFIRRQQIEQQRRKASVVKDAGDGAIAWTVPAAAAAVGKEHDAAGSGRKSERALEEDVIDVQPDETLRHAHAHTAEGYVSGNSPSSQSDVRSSGSTARVSS